MKNLLEVRDLRKYYSSTRKSLFTKNTKPIKAVDGISFDIEKGKTLGLVGESGCGKSTTGNCVLMLDRPTSGNIFFDGKNLTDLKDSELRLLRKRMQPIFQDPYSSLNPLLTIERAITEPMQIHGLVEKKDLRNRCYELLEMVGLNSYYASRYPHEFSGGERQRVVIARALASEPEFIVCDEPIASLDVSIQAQVVNLLKELQSLLNLTFLFIAHDLNMVRYISDKIAVMYLGRIVEIADAEELYLHPMHPYTKVLLSSVPFPDPHTRNGNERIQLIGEIPSPVNIPTGCSFHTRCPMKKPSCSEYIPELKAVENGHMVSCLLFNMV